MSTVSKLALIAILAVAAVSVAVLSSQSFSAEGSFRESQKLLKLKEKFQSYKEKFGLRFHTLEEDIFRFSVFIKNVEHINTQNALNQGFTLAINKFTHITLEEFKELFGFGREQAVNHKPEAYPILSTENLPESVDWVERGAVTPVKDQGKCGACYTFSSTGGLEGAYFVKTGQLLSFSEQQLLDCTKPDGNSGCRGGLMTNSFYFVKQHGIETETQYPTAYRQKTDSKCESENEGPKISAFYGVRSGDCDQLAAAIAQQPTPVAVDAHDFQFYSSGVLSKCGKKLGHAVLAVGYTPEYWIIKNSWGPKFGMNGYIRLARGNTCGVCQEASYPIF